jgi:mono/diheme cytochrome c family protein
MTRMIAAAFLAVVGSVALCACGESQAAESSAPARKGMERVTRGRYLVNAIGCSDCHTPFKMGPHGPERDQARFLSGHPESFKPGPAPELKDGWIMAMPASGTAFKGPWGTSYAMNLTPDPITGIGIWTEDMFVRAIKEGKHWGSSRPIMPPMPWEFYRNLEEEDLKSIYAYLRTIPPVRNNVPAYEPPPSPEDE